MIDPLTDTSFPQYDERAARPVVSATIERALSYLLNGTPVSFSEGELKTALEFVQEFGVE